MFDFIVRKRFKITYYEEHNTPEMHYKITILQKCTTKSHYSRNALQNHNTPEMHYKITLRARSIHTFILTSPSSSRKPLGPFCSLYAETKRISMFIRSLDDFCAL